VSWEVFMPKAASGAGSSNAGSGIRTRAPLPGSGISSQISSICHFGTIRILIFLPTLLRVRRVIARVERFGDDAHGEILSKPLIIGMIPWLGWITSIEWRWPGYVGRQILDCLGVTRLVVVIPSPRPRAEPKHTATVAGKIPWKNYEMPFHYFNIYCIYYTWLS